ncbi:hypothetical protein EIP91_009671 [Steccherinum ochraceum]|uniref:GH16 domain-containing protein n=1 Tax=Steccherinum ochraceum TaxID=92696 RepID=A0A4R0RZQ2_9APHY|nr:hypothetical protein EIP91_009671 [Steccherinum ochraceum]
MHFTFSFAVAAASLVPSAFASIYSLSDNHVGKDFLTSFTHETIADPTHGRVNYVSQATALSKNLTFTNSNTLILRGDYKTKISASGPGRDSVRIKSVKSYDHHVTVFDVKHMPEGCGTWPAAWETTENGWPDSGEVDIEQCICCLLPGTNWPDSVNGKGPNQSTLHTNANCNMPASRTQNGVATSNVCDVVASNNVGCSVQSTAPNSFGTSFNANGGGYYAMERMNKLVNVWFWPRNGAVPNDLKSGAKTVDTGKWGTPNAYFPDTSCDLDAHFGSNNIIIDLTFCGDWAGLPAIFNGAGCPGDCATYVNDNPGAFSNAYWWINAVRVYT